MPEALKGSETLNDKTILIRARITTQQEKTLTCRLEDGFGNAEVTIHQDAAITDTKTPAA